MGMILQAGIFIVIVIVGLTIAIIAAAPYIAIGAVVLGLGYLAIGSGDEDPPDDGSGPPVVR